MRIQWAPAEAIDSGQSPFDRHPPHFYNRLGGVVEWFKAAVLKTAGRLCLPVGSNPTPSAVELIRAE